MLNCKILETLFLKSGNGHICYNHFYLIVLEALVHGVGQEIEIRVKD